MKYRMLLFLVTGFLKKIPGINQLHQQQKKKLYQQFKITLSFHQIHLTSYNTISITQLVMQDGSGRLRFTAGRIKVGVKFRKLLAGKIQPDHIKMHDACVEIGRRRAKTTQQTDGALPTPFPLKKLYKTINRITRYLHLVPEKLDITNTTCSLNNGPQVQVQKFVLQQGRYETLAHYTIAGDLYEMEAQGTLHTSDTSFTYSVQVPRVTIPENVLPHAFPYRVILEELHLQGMRQNRPNKETRFSIEAAAKKVYLQNPATIHTMQPASFQAIATANFHPHGFFIEQGSFARFNTLLFDFHMTHAFDDDQVALGLAMQKCTMPNLLKSLPSLLFQPLSTATFSGSFGFSAVMKFPLANPYDRLFEVNVHNDLQLQSPGLMNMENIQDIKKRNACFTPIEQIPHILKWAVICSEDPCFYEHRGIHIPSIGFALAANIAEKRLTRGASTITMQVVKNLFLTHQRSLTRKIEEVILSWLVENIYHINKDQLFEIYLNLIEFGPGIYGIGEAARFYFNKTPMQLTLTESLVLTYIIPRPGFFLDALNMQSPRLVKNLRKHFDFYTEKMLAQGYITAAEAGSVLYNIQFSAPMNTLQL